MRVRLGVAIVTALLAGVVGAPAAAAQPAPDPLAKATATVSPAVVYVEVTWNGQIRDRATGQLYADSAWTLTTVCSGFAVSSDGYMVTAGHCVDQAHAMPAFALTVAQRYLQAGRITEAGRPAFLADMNVNGQIESATAGTPARQVFVQRDTARPGLTTGEALAARVVDEPKAGASDPKTGAGDIALLKVEKTNQPMVVLNRAADPAVGTEVLALGYPAAQPNADTATAVTRTGAVTAVSGDASLQTDAAVMPGMDGGPLANLKGEVVGVLSHASVGAGPPSVAVAVSSSDVVAELQRQGVHNDLGKVDKDYRDGLDAYYAGHYSEAITKFDSVLALVPSHAQAQQYQQKAVTLRQAEGESADNHLLLYAGAGVAILVVLLILILVLVLRARTRGRPPADAAVPSSESPAPASEGAKTIPTVPTVPVFKPATDDPDLPADRPAVGGVPGAPSFSAPPVSAAPVGDPPTASSTAAVFAEPVPAGAPVPSGASPPPARRLPPSLVYCSNCGLAAAPDTEACAVCGKRFA
jgi:serine protease Do